MLKTRDFVQAKLYEREDDVLQDALRHLVRARPDYRLPLALSRYQNEEISLAKAATLAGVSWLQMREILIENGIEPRLGPETEEEIEEEIEVLDFYFERQP